MSERSFPLQRVFRPVAKCNSFSRSLAQFFRLQIDASSFPPQNYCFFLIYASFWLLIFHFYLSMLKKSLLNVRIVLSLYKKYPFLIEKESTCCTTLRIAQIQKKKHEIQFVLLSSWIILRLSSERWSLHLRERRRDTDLFLPQILLFCHYFLLRMCHLLYRG